MYTIHKISLKPLFIREINHHKVYTKSTQSLHKVYTNAIRKAYKSIRKAYESIRKAYGFIRKAYKILLPRSLDIAKGMRASDLQIS